MFGASWGNLGSTAETTVRACVGGIELGDDCRIGLSAMQMDNLGYHPRAIFRVALNKSSRFYLVKTYNAFGPKALSKDEIWVSKELADNLQLQLGDVITIKRTSQPLPRRER